MRTERLVAATFLNTGKKELFLPPIYTESSVENARLGSMDFAIRRTESECGMKWRYFFRGNEFRGTIIETDYRL